MRGRDVLVGIGGLLIAFQTAYTQPANVKVPEPIPLEERCYLHVDLNTKNLYGKEANGIKWKASYWVNITGCDKYEGLKYIYFRRAKLPGGQLTGVLISLGKFAGIDKIENNEQLRLRDEFHEKTDRGEKTGYIDFKPQDIDQAITHNLVLFRTLEEMAEQADLNEEELTQAHGKERTDCSP